ncbi:hypothetical protein COMNV_01256 [Commensalibacter sp. Nvir]|uniref:hypothetical protein n=1 Tax=Commensalibacter sp. Nvir TaxID=3069817 RepID=UPI002D475FDF|nr:hypothetical protein COMNV_01256 [Commensalibacter sp. Nvir]
MNRFLLFFIIFLMSITNAFSISKKEENDIFFIKKEPLGSWDLYEYYNKIILNLNKTNLPFSLTIKPNQYSLILQVNFHQFLYQNEPFLELNIGDFNHQLIQTKDKLIYQTTLEALDSLDFFKEIKKNNTVMVFFDDNKKLSISIDDINHTLLSLENFAKDHYILLPPPFSPKLDYYSTMPIPDIFTTALFPIYRQYAYTFDQCTQKKHNTDDCNKNNLLRKLIETQHICLKQNITLAQSFLQKDTVSDQWVKCN